MNYYPKVKKFVKESFKHSKFGNELRHFWRTAYWLKKLDPKADEAMLIAAVAHDIERAFPISRLKWQKGDKAYFLQRSFSAAHGRAGAFKVGEFLQKERAPRALIKKVKMMISRHEYGGNYWQNLLKDADSISFLENQGPLFLKFHRSGSMASGDVLKKFDWMYGRITSRQAKAYAKPMYQKCVKYLNKFYKNT
ncbi:MAG: DUF4202 family protein [Patescibacteria group bacterium]